MKQLGLFPVLVPAFEAPGPATAAEPLPLAVCVGVVVLLPLLIPPPPPGPVPLMPLHTLALVCTTELGVPLGDETAGVDRMALLVVVVVVLLLLLLLPVTEDMSMLGGFMVFL